MPIASLPRQPRGRPPTAALGDPHPLDLVCAALAHRGRRAIVQLLRHYGVMSARKIGESLPLAGQSAISAHLRVLREAGLVEAYVSASNLRERTYRLAPHAAAELRRWLAQQWPDSLEDSLAARREMAQDCGALEQIARALAAGPAPGPPTGGTSGSAGGTAS